MEGIIIRYSVEIMIMASIESDSPETAIKMAEAATINSPESVEWDLWSCIDDDGIEYDANGSIIE